jgi:purine-binding chemotaxis protein CheW
MTAAVQCLLCQVDTSYLALPISHVIEVSRPLPLTRVVDAPEWIAGVAVMRGMVTPVIDARRLLGSPPAGGDDRASRWVALRVDRRRVALSVDAVLRAGALPEADRTEITPLVASSPLFSALGTLDAKLLLVFSGARLLAQDAASAVEGYAGGR